METPAAPSCPIPLREYPRVVLAHGGGGRLGQHLVQKMFRAAWGNPLLDLLHDGAMMTVAAGRLAFTTDSYVVHPLFFPGGDIGSLAVFGTVNDLAVCGARPLCLSCGFILEEGLEMEELWRVVRSMGEAAREAGVPIVTGDTKVVEKGKGDRLFVNTSGIGLIPPGVDISPRGARPGDRIILNGPVASHGVAIMSVREGLEFETAVRSDSAPLHNLVAAMLEAAPEIRVLRDPTRGGVATVLNEIASASGVGIEIRERDIPVPEGVRGACELLGLDPLYVANEGKLLAFVPPAAANRVLAVMRTLEAGKESVVIGEVTDAHPGTVVMESSIGGRRMVSMLSGEQLPRIC
ncbi:MAG: hydrogenase expression/formation protein HypE [Bacteroidota bacterium]